MGAIKFLLIFLSIASALALAVKISRTPGAARVSFDFSLKGAVIGICIVVAAILLASAFGQVPAGSRGVVLRFGAVTGVTLPEGIYMVIPAVETVQLMSVQVEAYEAAAEAASKDLQDVKTNVTLNFAVSPKKAGSVYQTLGYEYKDRIIKPAVQEGVKSATAKYNAEELITKRPMVKAEIEKFLADRLIQHGIVLDGISITDFKFSSEFTNSVERKVTAVQDSQAEQNKKEKETYIAQQKVIAAKGEADALKLKREQLTPEMIKYEAVKKWNGQLPTYMGGNSPIPFIDVK
jgi:prohibitin 2